MGALDFLSEVWAGGGTIIILELSSQSTFLLCFIHSWSPVKLWIRAVKSLALLEGMERRVKAGKPLSLRDLSLALGFRSGWLSSVVERVNLCVPARLFQKTCSASCCAGAPLGQRDLPVPLFRSGSTQLQLERCHLSACICTHKHRSQAAQCESFVTLLLLSYLRVWIVWGLQIL